MEFDATEFVHEYEGRWIVAQYRGGRYYAPQRTSVQRLTGCHTTFGSLNYVSGDAYSYKRRSDALRKARELYDPQPPSTGLFGNRFAK